MNPHSCGQLIYNKGGKNIWWKKDNLFNKCFWKNWSATCRKIKLDCFLIKYTKVNSNCIEDFNVRPEAIKLLEENIGVTLVFFCLFVCLFVCFVFLRATSVAYGSSRARGWIRTTAASLCHNHGNVGSKPHICDPCLAVMLDL